MQSHFHSELGRTSIDDSGEFSHNVNLLQLQSKKNYGKPGLDQVNAYVIANFNELISPPRFLSSLQRPLKATC